MYTFEYESKYGPKELFTDHQTVNLSLTLSLNYFILTTSISHLTEITRVDKIKKHSLCNKFANKLIGWRLYSRQNTKFINSGIKCDKHINGNF